MNYLERALYWCHHNGHTEATLLMTEVLNMGTGKGALSYIIFQAQSWKFAGPTKAELAALDGPTVDAWIDGYKKGIEADYKKWPEKKLRAAFTALVKMVNLRLPEGQKITEAEMKAALKAEM